MFKLLKIENARQNVPSPAYYEVTAGEAVAIGEALVLTEGKLKKCGPQVKPEFIAMGDKTAAATDRKLAVCRCAANQLYGVPVTAAPTGLKPGDKVTLHADGLQVTATTSNGVITVESIDGATAAGDEIVVRIV